MGDRERQRSELEKKIAALAALAKSNKHRHDDLDETLQEIIKTAADTLAVDRVGVWLFNGAHSQIELRLEYLQKKRQYTRGRMLTRADFPRYFQALESDRVIVAADAVTDKRTKELDEAYLRPYGISSMLDAPIRVGGQTIGVVCHEQIGPARVWMEDEISFAGSIGDLVALAIETDQRRRAERERDQLQERFSKAFQANPSAISISTFAEGRYLDANRAFLRALGYTREEVIGHTAVELQTWASLAERRQVVHTLLAHGRIPQIETRLRTKQGEVRYTLSSFETIELEGEKYVLGMFIDISARVKVESELRRSQAQLAGVIASAMDAIITVDEDQRIRLFNEAAETMFGCAAETVLGQSIERFIPAPYRQRHAAYIQAFAESGDTNRKMGKLGTLFGERADGSVFPLEASISQTEMGGQQLFTVILRDITERLQAEEALRQSEARYRAIVEDQTEFIVRWKPDGQLTFVNEAYARYFQEAPQRLVGTTFWPHIPAQDQRRILEAIYRLTPEGPAVTSSNRAQMPGGEERWHQWTDRGIFDDHGRLVEIQSVGRDVTQQRRAELERERLMAELQAQTAQMQLVMDSAPDGVLLLTADGRVLRQNPRGKRYLDILAAYDEAERLASLGARPLAALLTSPPKGLWHETAVDDTIFEIIARPLENGKENSGWVMIIRDITREREVQRHAQQREKLAAIGQLSAGIAHDFNNILAVILLYVQMALRMEKLSPRLREQLATVEQQSMRASDLIQQILDFSRQAVLDKRPLDLLTFLEGVVKLLRRTLPETIQVTLTATSADYTVHADPSRMQQIVMNLAVNARDAMPNGGVLSFRLQTVSLRPGKVAPVPDMPPGSWVQLTVSDTGLGISEEALAHIFQPFYTTKPQGQGTGLGLAQVYGIVQQHDGFIDVTSAAEKGTRFDMYFPAFIISESAELAAPTAVLPQGHGEMILVVEDEPMIRQAMIESLKLLNYRVVTATNGREAMRLLQAEDGAVALVLSDVVMPEMGGRALLHAIKGMGLNLPLVLVTGHPLENEMPDWRAQGVADWLTKPVNLQQLADTLARHLRPDL